MTLVVKFPFSIFLLSRHDKINPPASLSIFSFFFYVTKAGHKEDGTHTKKSMRTFLFFPSRVPLIFSSLFSCSMRRGNLTQQPCYSFSHASVLHCDRTQCRIMLRSEKSPSCIIFRMLLLLLISKEKVCFSSFFKKKKTVFEN